VTIDTSKFELKPQQDEAKGIGSTRVPYISSRRVMYSYSVWVDLELIREDEPTVAAIHECGNRIHGFITLSGADLAGSLREIKPDRIEYMVTFNLLVDRELEFERPPVLHVAFPSAVLETRCRGVAVSVEPIGRFVNATQPLDMNLLMKHISAIDGATVAQAREPRVESTWPKHPMLPAHLSPGVLKGTI
jgi:hypothetical protein